MDKVGKTHSQDHYKRHIFTLEIVPEEEKIIITYPSGTRYQYDVDVDSCNFFAERYERIKAMAPASANELLGHLIKEIKDIAGGYTQI